MKAVDYVPTSRADARAYAGFVLENFEPWDWPWDRIRRRRKRRGLSLRRVIAQARKAGVDATIVTSEGTVTLRFGAREQLGGDTAPIDCSEWN
jgi:hypothetical protein